MICQYCSAQNVSEDHRCGRCGRRLTESDDNRRRASIPFHSQATAPVLETVEDVSQQFEPDVLELPKRPQLVTQLPRSVEGREFSHQGNLFGPQEIRRDAQKLNPASRVRRAPQPQRGERQQPAQPFLFEAAEGARTAGTTEAAVYCDAPVAIATHRALAGALDLAMVAIASAVFVVSATMISDVPLFTGKLWVFAVAAFVLIAAFYRLLFCFGNSDTLGCHWAGLRLLNFDGRLPTRRERLNRALSSVVSILSIGIGFLWAVFDEERLAWHDYMSKTFPTPRM
ncbi:MAG TPA: RDD family protein [Bryobacteraceae bacterium]|nr:RDD family protein [Bryobacteraceae bacterium]